MINFNKMKQVYKHIKKSNVAGLLVLFFVFTGLGHQIIDINAINVVNSIDLSDHQNNKSDDNSSNQTQSSAEIELEEEVTLDETWKTSGIYIQGLELEHNHCCLTSPALAGYTQSYFRPPEIS